jgi:hypothetical protein
MTVRSIAYLKPIHRLLETDPRTGNFRRNEEAALDCDLLVVDETSMVDMPLMRAVLLALPTRAVLLLRPALKYVATWLIDEWSKIGLHVTQRVVPDGPPGSTQCGPDKGSMSCRNPPFRP